MAGMATLVSAPASTTAAMNAFFLSSSFNSTLTREWK